jgi:hypothetical protein
LNQIAEHFFLDETMYTNNNLDTIDQQELGMNIYTLEEALRVKGGKNDSSMYQIKLEVPPKNSNI